jgi:hypothetical protein
MGLLVVIVQRILDFAYKDSFKLRNLGALADTPVARP